MSEVPYYLNPNVLPQYPSNSIFNIGITTEVPDGLAYQEDVASIWERAGETAVEVATGAYEGSKSLASAAIKVPGQLLDYSLETGGKVLDSVSNSVGNVAGNLFSPIAKYFLLIVGGIILLVFVLGKSGAFPAIAAVAGRG